TSGTDRALRRILAGPSRTQRNELKWTDARTGVERGPAGGRDGEDRLAPLASGGSEPRRARSRRERGRKHRADRVRQSTSVALGDPRGERELMRPQEREWMEERVDRLELSVDHTVERDDNPGDRPRSQRDANEMTRRERETFWHDVAECSCRTAEPG